MGGGNLNRTSDFIKVFVGHVVEGKCRDGSIGVLLTLGEESDKARDVFLELRQEKGHIVLVEHSVLIVLHMVGHCKHKVAGLKLVNHALNVVLDLVHLGLDITNLSFFASVFVLYLIDLLLKVGAGIFFLGIRH